MPEVRSRDSTARSRTRFAPAHGGRAEGVVADNAALLGVLDDIGSRRTGCRNDASVLGWSEAEDQGKGIVYRSELIGIETPRGPPKSLWIYHRSLLDEDSGLGPVE